MWSLLSVKMQWLAMLQTHVGQACFEMPECTPSSTHLQTLICKLTHVPADLCLDTDSFVYSLQWGSLWVEISTLACEADLLF